MNATTFTTICECFRCGGFKDAFTHLRLVNDGKCLRCDGKLRDVVTRPVAELAAYYPDAEALRAETIATIAKVLTVIGKAATVDAKGKRVSVWGFAYHAKGDDALMFCAALSRAPEDVRRRGWAAFVRTVNAEMPQRAEKIIAQARARVAQFTGLHAVDLPL